MFIGPGPAPEKFFSLNLINFNLTVIYGESPIYVEIYSENGATFTNQ